MIKHIAFTGDYSHLPNNIRHSENVALHEKFKDGIEFCNGVNIIVGEVRSILAKAIIGTLAEEGVRK